MSKKSLIHKYMPRVLSAALSVAVLCGTVGMTAYSAGTENGVQTTAQATDPNKKQSEKSADKNAKFTKEETVYVIADACGAPQKVIVSNWIKNPGKADVIKDKSNLSDIENVKGDETFTIDENKMVEWGADGNDIYYRGNSTQQLPVGVNAEYSLDGKAVSPSELAGKSGKVKMKFTYSNRQYEEVKIGGKKQKIYVPFVMLTGMMLDNEKFSNVTVSNGKVINDGTRTYVAGFALPGMQETLNLKKSEVEIPSTVEITADVKDFELATTITIATNELFNDIDISKLDGKIKELKDKLGELADGVDKLVDGSSQLYEGLGTLLDKSGELIDGVNKLYDGADQLSDGASQLEDGAGQLGDGAGQLDNGVASLQSGVSKLNDGAGDLSDGASAVDNGVAQLQGYIGTLTNGLGTISSNSEKLRGGAKQVFDALLSTADSQIAASGLSAPALTVDNYGAVLDGLVSQLGDDAVRQLAYNTAYDTVSATVNSQRDLIRQAVEAEVKKQVTNGVLNAAGLGMDSDAYDAAVAAGQISEDIQAQINAGIAAQMAGMTDTIDANTDAQITSLIETNMQGEEVQSQIEAAVAKAAAGRQSLTALKAQLDSFNTFYKGVIDYTNGVDEASGGADKILGGTAELKSGTQKLANGAGQLKSGTGELSSGADRLKSGSSQLKDGLSALGSGTVSLSEGAQQLFCGIASLKDGSGALLDGVSKLKDGGMQLSDGMKKLKKEGVDVMVNAVNGDLGDLAERFKAMINVSKNYKSFSGKADDTDGKVDFIFKTDSIKPQETSTQE